MNISNIIMQMIELFLIMGVGYICYKVKYIDIKSAKKMNILLLNVTTPCLILGSVSTGEVPYEKSIIFTILLIAFLMYIILPFVAFILNKLLKVEKENFGLYLFMTVFSNIGFMGYPVVKTIFGDNAVFLCSLFNMVFGLFAYSLGIYLFNLDKEESIKFEIKEMINPAMIASIIALFIFLLNIKLPLMISDTFVTIGNITTPLAMMLIGSSLATMPVKEIFKEYKLYPYTLIKQIIIPLLALILLKPILTDPLILGITVVVLAMPVGNISNIFANRFDGNYQLASKSIFITTICSFITIPILCYIL
ncbi:AEC family transporter [Anaerofustis stercorihominis]|uniref:AEC family transporter n=1 Tax=Anaerofustis stercorihominis TaxID=214853 RepID=UPI00214ADD25|nr:AEC family transporter [Anaerofustis stercorihominis]MCR2032614.1 AEC family transporter [Anaerofustis stercorihominis]